MPKDKRSTVLTADPLNFGQGFGLAVVADFDYAGCDQDDGAHRRRYRERNIAIRGCHVGMKAAQARCDHESQDAEQQAQGESE